MPGLLEQYEFESFDNAASVLMKSLRPDGKDVEFGHTRIIS